MKHLLAIDTSTERASIALAVDDTVLHAQQNNIREHAKYILPMIEELLFQSGLALANLDGIVYGRGPGSFTGIRVACSVVKGLAYPHDLPLYPVSSLAAIAEDVFHSEIEKTEAAVLTLIDARMHEVYWDYYLHDGSHQSEHVSAASAIEVPQDRPLIIAGVGLDAYFSQLPLFIQQQCIQRHTIYPDARAMIRWVRAGRSECVNAQQALPVYVRNQVVQGAANG